MLAIMVRHALRRRNVHVSETLWQKIVTLQKAEAYQSQALLFSLTQLGGCFG